MTLYTASPDEAKKLIRAQVKASSHSNTEHINNTQTVTLGPIQSAVEIKDKLFHLVKRIHGCYSPVGNADSQEEEGDDRVEKGRPDVSNGPESKSVGERER